MTGDVDTRSAAGTALVLDEVARQGSTRKDVAVYYAFALQDRATDWHEINEAIVEKWSPAGLKFIKERAWRLVGRVTTNQENPRCLTSFRLTTPR